MYLRHQAYTLYYRHVCILVFLHVFAYSMQGRRQRGGSGARPPYLKSVPPHFTVGLLVAKSWRRS